MTDQPRKTLGYRNLLARFGQGRLGDAILAKWRTDEDSQEQWERLERDIDPPPDRLEDARRRRWLEKRRLGR